MASQGKDFWARNQSPKAQRAIGSLARALAVDVRALNILFNAYGDLDAPESRSDEPLEIPPADFAHAKQAGLIRETESHHHDTVIRDLRTLTAGLDRPAIARTFVAGLRSERRDWCSPLASYAYHLHHPAHVLRERPTQSTHMTCEDCGHTWRPGQEHIRLDFGDVQLMRIRAGGGIHHVNPGYALCDLTWFQQAGPAIPDAEDWSMLRATLQSIRELPADAELAELSKAVSKSLGGNKYSRQLTLETFGYCGILRPRARPPVLDRWFRLDEVLPSAFCKHDWKYPVNGWTGRDGVDDAAVAYWFPELT